MITSPVMKWVPLVAAQFWHTFRTEFLDGIRFLPGPLWPLALCIRMCFPTPSFVPPALRECPQEQSSVGDECSLWSQVFTLPCTYVTLQLLRL